MIGSNTTRGQSLKRPDGGSSLAETDSLEDSYALALSLDRLNSPMPVPNPYAAPPTATELLVKHPATTRWWRSPSFLFLSLAVPFAIQFAFLAYGIADWQQGISRMRPDSVVGIVAVLLGLTSCLVGMVGIAIKNRRMVVAAWSALATVYGTVWSLWIFG